MARNASLRCRVGFGMNRSVREGKKFKALWMVQRTGYCAIYIKIKNYLMTGLLLPLAETSDREQWLLVSPSKDRSVGNVG